jgi:16S rRNA (cytidine1402-2'-O)-methyltransferase
MREVLGDRQACLAREITKKFEEYIRGTLGGISDKLSGRAIKGEIVIVVAGAEKTRDDSEDE